MDEWMRIRPGLNTYVIYDSNPSDDDNEFPQRFYRFHRWKFNFSPKLMVSFKIKDFNLDLGGGYVWTSFSAYESETELRNFSMNGVTFSASLGYRFKSWKKE